MILDNLAEIKKLDQHSMLSSIEKLPDQVEQILAEVGGMKVPAGYKSVNQVLFLGMGGSALGAHCIKAIFGGKIKCPVEIINGYDVSGSVDKKTLVIGVSYSGNTEETLSALKIAKGKGAKIVVVTSGGELEQFALKNKIPSLVFQTENNPCGSPRMGLGYTIYGPLLILQKIGLLKTPGLKNIIDVLKDHNRKLGVEEREVLNPAKIIAQKFVNQAVWFFGAEHLSGNAHVAANQMNENAKRFGGFFLIPELNHHLMEGLMYPKSMGNFFIFLESDLYDERIKKRISITKEILQKNNAPFASYHCSEKDFLSQSAEALVFGSYLSYYSAILNGIDPTAIPYVDYFKAALKN